jgi:hypothetical protein
MKLYLKLGHYLCYFCYYLLWIPGKLFSFIERLLIREDKRDRLQIGYLDEYLTDELTTQVQDKKREKERKENIEKLVKDLEELKEIAVIKKIDTLKVAEFYEIHKKQFKSNLSAVKFCKIICVQFGIDYDKKIYRNFKNNSQKVA